MYDYLCHYDEAQKIWCNTRRSSIFNENISAGELAYFMLRNKNPLDIMQISDSEDTVLTYGSVLSTAIRIAQHFKKMELTEDDVVAIFASNTTYSMPVAIAAWFNGTPFLSMHTVIEASVCTKTFDKTKPKIIFCDGLHYEKVSKASAAFNPAIYTICNHLEDVAKIQELLEPTTTECDFKPKPLTRGSSQTMFIMLSSGTTAIPKCISYSNRYVTSYIPFTYQYDTMFCTSGIDWLSGLTMMIVNVLCGGVKVITSKPFTAEYLYEIIKKYNITVLSTNPMVIKLLAQLPTVNRESMRSIRFLRITGSFWPEKSIKVVRSIIPNAFILHVYGSTEAGLVSYNYKDYKLKSVGQIMPNLQLKIIDINTQERLGPNETGELCFRKTNEKWLGNYKNAEANLEIIDSEGFLHTGDLGYVDDEHYLYVVDRCNDRMKYMGYYWSPHDIEQIIAQIPDVKDVCVFDVYHEIKLNAPAAAIVKRPGSSLTALEVVDYVKQHTEVHYKNLDGGVFILNELLRNRNGKLMRSQIKEICLAMHGAENLHDNE